ncbi:hypothetical protein KAH94_01515 [bacterium]|nr:hypothetical protein [bacterium]
MNSIKKTILLFFIISNFANNTSKTMENKKDLYKLSFNETNVFLNKNEIKQSKLLSGYIKLKDFKKRKEEKELKQSKLLYDDIETNDSKTIDFSNLLKQNTQQDVETFFNLLQKKEVPEQLNSKELTKQIKIIDFFNCPTLLNQCSKLLLKKIEKTNLSKKITPLYDVPEHIKKYVLTPLFLKKFNKKNQLFNPDCLNTCKVPTAYKLNYKSRMINTLSQVSPNKFLFSYSSFCPNEKSSYNINSKKIFLYNIDTKKVLKTFKNNKNNIQNICYLANEKFCSTDITGLIKLWDLNKKNALGSFTCSGNPQFSTIALDENHIATSNRKSIFIYDINKQKQQNELLSKYENLTDFCQHDTNILSSWNDNTIKLWNIHENKSLKNFTNNSYSQTVRLCSLNEYQFLSESMCGNTYLWDTRKEKPIWIKGKKNSSFFKSLIKLDENLFASSSWNGNISINNILDGSTYKTFSCNETGLGCNSLFNGKNKSLIIISYDQGIIKSFEYDQEKKCSLEQLILCSHLLQEKNFPIDKNQSLYQIFKTLTPRMKKKLITYQLVKPPSKTKLFFEYFKKKETK